MNPRIRPILDELKAGLEELYGDRLDRVILYGSQARGDSGPESDIDVLVVLREPFDTVRELQRVVHLTTALDIRHGVAITPVMRTSADVELSHAFYRNVMHEGVRI
ncbi:nucleotidyltransferase domain-containing protein [Indioceanicola profundi]|uniref:nucleotidyltransferase domain-containing protein n=1 Tax=Indioceanicola profundi TaxID=2220096 RepID=UPI000E6ABB3F|nr:nucleotidyltransferase domain-containing protein [Indioceanicola profundi]